mgnify:CR=1 FL=1
MRHIVGVSQSTTPAEVEVGDEWAKSGMEGVARLDAGHRRPVWITFHGIVDTLRMHAPR